MSRWKLENWLKQAFRGKIGNVITKSRIKTNSKIQKEIHEFLKSRNIYGIPEWVHLKIKNHNNNNNTNIKKNTI